MRRVTLDGGAAVEYRDVPGPKANRRSEGHCRKLGEGCPSLGPCICGCTGCRDAKHVAMTTALKNGIPIEMPRRMPKQKPGKSEQIVVTPFELVDAVEARFGKLRFDLAATRENCRVRSDPSRFYGPGSSRGTNSLKKDWSKRKGLCWLNPPYGNIAPWAQKCAETELRPNTKIALLVPASVGSNWWREFVDGKADAYFLSPRIVFEDHTAGYPKDCAIVIYSGLKTHSYQCWRWRK